MARQRKDKNIKVKLARPDRSGPDPSRETLLHLAEERGLFKQTTAEDNQSSDESDPQDEPLVGRLGEAILWSISLTMLHFTLDVLVTHQYAVEISWPKLVSRAGQAFPIILFFFYIFHPHPSPSMLPLRLPQRIQPILHQLLFFVGSVAAGCYLIYITNVHGYFAVMKRAPPLGCLWIWSVVELDLLWAATSLICCIGFLKWGGYAFL